MIKNGHSYHKRSVVAESQEAQPQSMQNINHSWKKQKDRLIYFKKNNLLNNKTQILIYNVVIIND